ncbi:hypothetical protein H9X57_06120 [Flavobacterium piscinae]|uniref:hypothetical protein n=1 Tax=Flavobacterium piscinae TaxID=2506424 RepID=UPI001995F74F|nr:hypothetical protein [Flavobacterium piscinae]MBC8883123.1 hypothetical protein [Flavobacterium piscinae]
MKKVALICCLTFLISCKSGKTSSTSATAGNKPEFIKLPLSEVSSIKKNRAYELGKRVLMTCNTSFFKPFTKEEATEEVLKKLTKKRFP